MSNPHAFSHSDGGTCECLGLDTLRLPVWPSMYTAQVMVDGKTRWPGTSCCVFKNPFSWPRRTASIAWESLLRTHQVPIPPIQSLDRLTLWDPFSGQSPLPIYTLWVMTGRIYIVSDARLASIIQRRSDIFSFDPFVIIAAERLAGVTNEGMKLVKQNVAAGHLKPGLVFDLRDRMHEFLISSSSLERMSRSIFHNITATIQELGDNNDSVIDLFSWIKHTISITSTNTIYGPSNPFDTDPQVYAAFW